MQDGWQANDEPSACTRREVAMMKHKVTLEQSSTAIADSLEGTSRMRVRGARRAANAISARVTDEELAVIAEHARRGGYASVAEYVRAVCVAPCAVYDTDAARIAKPLSDISYRIARVLDALNRSETDAVRGYLTEMKAIVHAALVPIARSHDREVRSRE